MRKFEEMILDTNSITEEEFMSLSKAQITQLALSLQKAVRPKGPGRKDEILALLKQGPQSIRDMAEAVGIKPTNVSSQLKYLKDAGWVIHVDDQGRRYLASETPRVIEIEAPEVLEEQPEA